MIYASGQSERAAFGGPVLAAIGAAVLAFAYGPLLWEFAGNLWSRPYYQHFPYVLLAAGLLGYRDLQTPARAAARSRFAVPPLALIVPAWLLLVLAIFALSPLLSAVSAILLTGGLLSLYCRHAGVRFPAGPWLLLWLLIPPPVGLDQRLLTRLQLTSSDLASKALDLLGVGHLMEGNALILPTRQLFVDEACSGIVSVISLSACGAIYAVWRRRPLLHAALLMAAAVGWAVLMNVLRITVIALAEANAGVDLAEGAPHLLLGLGVFALNLLAVIAIDWLLHALLAEVDPPEDLPAEPYLIRLWNHLFNEPSPQHRERLGEGARPTPSTRTPKQAVIPATLAFAAFTAAALVQLAFPPESRLAVKYTKTLPVNDLLAALLAPGTMPSALGDLKLVSVEQINRERDDIFGKHSITWEYWDPTGNPVLFSCDFPFTGRWHELSVCYDAIGWNIDRRRVQTTSQREGACKPIVLTLSHPDKRTALVAFREFDTGCEPIPPPSLSGPAMLATEAVMGHRHRFTNREFYQLQIMRNWKNTRNIDAGSEVAALMPTFSTAIRNRIWPVLSLPEPHPATGSAAPTTE